MADIPPHLQREVAEFQQLQQTFQMLVGQKQQIEREVKEIDRAFSELQKHPDDLPSYKIVGGIMIRQGRLSLLKDLTEMKELLNIRVPSIKQQETRMKQEIQRRQQHLQESLQRKESQQDSNI